MHLMAFMSIKLNLLRHFASLAAGFLLNDHHKKPTTLFFLNSRIWHLQVLDGADQSILLENNLRS